MPGDHRALEVRRVLVENVEAAIGERVLHLVPTAVTQLVRRVLHEERHHMLAGGSDRRVDDGRNRALEDRVCGRASVLGVVERLLHVVERRRDVDRPAEVRVGREAPVLDRAERGELRERDVDLERRARIVDRADRGQELVRECRGVHEIEKRDVRVGARHDARRPILRAVRERHTGRTSVPRENARHRAVRPDLRTVDTCRRGQRFADAAHAAAHVAPHPSHAVALAHDVVKQHVRRARHGRRGHRADDRVGCERDLQLLGLEPAVEDGPRGAGQDLERARAVTPEPEEAPAEAREL